MAAALLGRRRGCCQSAAQMLERFLWIALLATNLLASPSSGQTANFFFTNTDRPSVPEGSPVGTRVIQLQTEIPVNQFTLLSTGIPFEVDQCTGLLQVAGPLDRERRSSYSLDVLANSTDGAIAGQLMTIDITDVNDNAPQCTAASYSTNVARNHVPITALQFELGARCYDNDEAGTVNSEIVYILSAGNELNYFNIDAVTGQLTLTKTLSTPAAPQAFSLTVVLADQGKPQMSSQVTLSITVTAPNVGPPAFNATNYSFAGDENWTGAIGGVAAIDPDLAPGNIVTYRFNSAIAGISISPTSGVVSLDNKFDYETGPNVYIVTVVATDSAAPSTRRSSTATVTITILDVNEPPMFILPPSNITVSEDVKINTTVLVMRCADSEPGKLAYHIIGQMQSGAAPFAIEANTGDLTVIGAVNADGAVANYSLDITCSDSGNPPLVGAARLNIILKPVNEHSPIFTNATGYVFNVRENTRLGASVGLLTADDRDSGLQGEVTYRITSPILVPPVLDLNHGTGQLTVGSLLDYDNATQSRQYVFTVIATDSAQPPSTPRSSTVSVTINVLDVNDNSPTFTSAKYQQTITGSYKSGDSVLALRCTDSDQLDAGKLVYRFAALPGSMVVQQLLQINSKDGLITVRDSSLLTQDGNYSTVVECYDTDNHTGRATIGITVVSFIPNNASPVFLPPQYNIAVRENTAVGSIITTVTATDSDPGLAGHVIYSLIYNVSDPMVVDINPFTGQVNLTAVLDFESRRQYQLQVRAIDEGNKVGGASRNTTTWFNITVVDFSDPVFPPSGYMFSTPENTAAATQIGVVKCTDRDSSGLSSLTGIRYSADFGGNFAVNGISGAVTVTGGLNFDTQPVQVFAVRCTLNNVTASTNITVNLSPVNEFSPTILGMTAVNSKSFLTLYRYWVLVLREDWKVGTVVWRINATDGDSNSSRDGQLTYSITQTAGGIGVTVPSLFRMDSRTGEATLIRAAVWQDGVSYSFILSVTDGGGRATRVLVFTQFADTNNHVPALQRLQYDTTVAEDAPPGTTIQFLQCSDLDGNVFTHGKLSMKITGGNEKGYFDLQHTPSTQSDVTGSAVVDGSVTLKASLVDISANATFNLQITCSDSGNLSSSSSLRVVVNYTNIHSPVFVAASSYNFNVSEDAAIGTFVGKVTAVDADTDSRYNKVTYSLPGIGNMAGAFNINYTSGAISTNSSLDFDTLPRYTLTVEASDGARKASANVSIQLVDINDIDPVFVGSYAISMPSTPPIGFVVVTLSVKDADTVGTLMFFSPTAPSWLSLNADTGEISVTSTPSGDVTFPVHVIDGRASSSDTTNVSIVLMGIATVPTFTDSVYLFTVQENTAVPAGGLVLTGLPVSATYTRPVVYSIVAGNQPATFSMNMSTGVFYLDRMVDRERFSGYTLTVQADGGGGEVGQATIDVRILDVNDNTPKPVVSRQTVTVRPNHTVDTSVAVAMCSDADLGANGAVVYQIINGSRGHFSINGTSGIVQLTQVIHDNIFSISYSLLIECSDLGVPTSLSSTFVMVIDIEFSNTAPRFDRNPRSVSVSEAEPMGASVTKVTAIDPDSPPYGSLLYTIVSGDPTGDFQLNSTTGELTLSRTLDRETTASYSLRIEARDQAPRPLSDFLSLTVTVLDVNDNRPTFSPAALSLQVRSQLSVGTVVATLNATDADLGINGAFNLMILSGNVNDTFSIDTTKQQLILARPFNRTVTSSFTLLIQAEDFGSPQLTSSPSATVLITVLGSAPAFLNSSYSVVLLDNLAVLSPVISVTAQDVDTSISLGLYYSIVSGNSMNHFDIFACSGRIYLAMPINAGLISNYTLVISAVVRGLPLLATNTTVTVLVKDQNEPPQCDNSTYVVSVYEGIRDLGRLVCSDRDVMRNRNFSYSLSDTHGNAILLDRLTGRLSLPRIVYVSVETCYNTTVIVTDLGTPPQRTLVPTRVCILSRIQLTPVSDTAIVVESILPNTIISSFSGKDLADTSAVLSYAISAGNTAGSFAIDSFGNVVLTGRLDFEVTTQYNLTIKAFSSSSTALLSSSSSSLHITVLDSNDNAPVISPSQYVATVNESTTVDRVIVVFKCTDKDSGSNGRTSFDITQGNTLAAFRINASSGQVSLSHSLDYENQTLRSFGLTIRCSDAGATSLFSLASLKIQVTNVNEFAPSFVDAATYSRNISEAASIGTNVLTVRAVDLDKDAITFSLVTAVGDPALPFTLDPQLGHLLVSQSLDFDQSHSYHLTVSASDGALTTTTAVNISISDANTYAPEFNQSIFNVVASESLPVPSSLLQVECTDKDHGTNALVNYTVVTGSHSSYLTVSSDGDISLVRSLDFETLASLSVEILCSDDGFPSLSSSSLVIVQVASSNEHSPNFSSTLYTSSVPETLRPGSVVIVVTATDSDKGVDGVLSYSLAAGQDTSYFQLTSMSGDLLLAKSLDFEQQQSFRLVVIARDGGGLQSNTSVLINVVDVNDIQPTCNQSRHDTSVLETRPAGYPVAQLRCTDGDAVDAQLSYVFSAASSIPQFKVYSNGTVATSTALDADSQSTEVVYNLQVIVSDAALHQTTVDIRVRVLAVNEFSPQFTQAVYTVTVPENTAIGRDVLRVNATDQDSDTDGAVQYSWLGSASLTQGPFSLDAGNGDIQLLSTLDFETGTNAYTLTVVARDGAGLQQRNATAQCDIVVSDVNDNPPVITNNGGTLRFYVSANQTGGDIVAALQVTDADSAPFSTHRCTIVQGNSGNLFQLVGDLDVIVNSTIRRVSDVKTSGLVTLLIQCVDLQNALLNTTAQVLVQVTEVNLLPPLFNTSISLNVTVLENITVNTAVLTVHATDPDDVTRPITYAISQGNQDGAFFLGPSTGVLQVVQRLNRESRTEYRLTVSAKDTGSDISRESFATVTITVGDINDNTPILTPRSLTLTVTEGKPINSHLAQLTCTDADLGSNGKTTVEIAASQPSVLAVNATGSLQLNNTLDYSQQPSYHVTVICRDNGQPAKSTTSSVRLIVIPGNVNSPRFVQPSYSVRVAEDAAFASTLLTLNATDGDSGSAGTLVFTLLTSDGGSFSLDRQTGVLSLVGQLDYETKHVYYIVAEVNNPAPYQWLCSASNQSVPCRQLRTNITVNVEDVNDNSPKCPPPVPSIRLNESVAVGTVVASLGCTDADSGLNKKLVYSVQAGISHNPGNSFQVDSSTGDVFVNSPLSKLLSTFYNIWISVSDSHPVSPRSTQVFIYVEVIPVNLYRPVFTSAIYYASVMENTAIGTNLIRVNATDADKQPLTYSLQAAGNVNNHFSIRSTSGEVLTNGRLDRETTSFYTLTVNASDDSQPVTFISQATINVTVIDYNDHVPLFRPAFYSAMISENTTAGASLLQLTCTDGDQAGTNNTELSLTIVSGNLSIFDVSDAGVLSLQPGVELDYEQERSHSLIIECSDAGQPRLSSTASASITVLPVNEFTPTFPQSSYDINIPENVAVGQTVTTLKADDPDSGTHGVLLYKLTSGNSDGVFYLDERSGILGLRRQLTATDSKQFTLTVTATDGGGASGKTTVNINVTDLNNNDPHCDPTTYSFKVSENITGRVEVGRLSCTDQDSGLSATLRYLISAGDTGSQFSIENSTGRMFVLPPLNRGSQAVYSLLVVVQDQGPVPRSITVSVLVEVVAVNRFKPAFANAPYQAAVMENAVTGTLVVNVSASDADSDEYGKVTFSITSGNTGNAFVIDPPTGRVYVANTLDWETQPTYVLTILASDSAPSSIQLSTSTTLTITIINVNDHIPQFSQAVYSVVLPLSTVSGHTVTQVSCSDRDAPASNMAATYSIVAGNLDSTFAMNASTGVVTVRASLLNLPSAFVLTVQCTDKGPGSSQSSQASVAVVLSSQNNFAPTFTSSRYTVNVSEAIHVPQVITVVSAKDNDLGSSGQVTYSISSGNTGTIFNLDPSTGNISILVSLDREAVSSYLLEVTATDGGNPPNTSSTFVSVSVTDVNDNVPQLSPAFTALTYLDDVTFPHMLASLTCTDRDLSPSLSYQFNATNSSGANVPAAAFQVLATGVVQQKSHIATGTYQLAVTCSDGLHTSKTSVVALTINPSTVHVPPFQQSRYNVPIFEGRQLTASFITLSLQTSPPVGTFQFSIVSGNVGNRFLIGSQTGEVHLGGTLDRETIPLYTLNITATPAFPTTVPVVSAYTELVVTVADVNDQAPKFNVPLPTRVTVNESIGVGSTLAVLPCTDADLAGTVNAKLDLLIKSGNSGSQFALRGLAPQTELWLQAPLDYERQTFHSITVECHDSGDPKLVASTVVALLVTPINEHEPTFGPEFNNTIYNTSVFENATVGSVLITVSASDADSSGDSSILYTLRNSDGVFAIDRQSGAIRLLKPLDASTKNYYVLTVTAMDNYVAGVAGSKSFSSQAIVGIRVLEARQDHSPVLLPERVDLSIAENATVGTVLAKFTCTDGDGDRTRIIWPATEPWYTLVNLTATGELVLAQSLDYEKVKSYTLQVRCSDQRSQPLTDFSVVYIQILPINEQIPTFNASMYYVSVSEGASVGSSIGQVFAQDSDDGDQGSFQYRLISGNVDNTFSLIGGELLVDRPLDYEGTQQYDLVISAAEITSPERSSTSRVIVNVVNVNDNRPSCGSAPYRATIPSSAGRGYSVVMLNCTDNDDFVANASSSDYLTYTIVAGDTSSFLILVSGDLQLLAGVSSRIEKHLQVQIGVSDRGVPVLNTTVLVLVTVLGRADATPVFRSLEYSANVSDLALVNTTITIVTATDADVGQTITYGLTSTTASDLPFAIDPRFGLVYLAKSVSSASSRTYQLNVTATDNGLPTRTGVARITIKVYRGDKQFLIVAPPFDARMVRENSTVGTTIAQFNCTDNRGLSNASFQVSLTSGNIFNAFDVFPNGTVSLAKQLNDSLLSYSLHLHCHDAANPALQTSDTILQVTVIPVNNHPPVFEQSTYNGSVGEGASLADAILTVLAHDRDHGSHGKLSYFIVSGDTNDDLYLDAQTGVLSVASSLDRETTSSYTLLVGARDTDANGDVLADYTSVFITVDDVNDERPAFARSVQSTTLSEDTLVDTVVANVSATDKDIGENGRLTFSLLPAGNINGTFKLFQSSNDEAEVVLASKLSVSSRASYHLEIMVQDHGVPAQSGLANVYIGVDPVNDFTPVFSQPMHTLNVSELTGVGTTVFVASATDGDQIGPDGSVVYRLLPGSSDVFTMDRHGVLTLQRSLDYELTRQYTLTLQASDEGSPPRTSQSILIINVLDANDNSPVCNASTVISYVNEGNYTGNNSIEIAMVSCDDQDSQLNAVLSYHLVDNFNMFLINRTSGALWVTGVLDANTRDHYQLDIQVRDSGLVSLQIDVTALVFVRPINDHTPKFLQSVYIATVPEDQATSSVVLLISATDQDTGVFGNVYYEVVNTSSALPFSLDGTTGAVYLEVQLDREMQDSYTFDVEAFNKDPANQAIAKSVVTARVYINVSDVNDNRPVFSQAQYNGSVVENGGGGYSVVTVLATDADLGTNANIVYSFVSGNTNSAFVILRNGTISTDTSLDYEQSHSYRLVIQASDLSTDAQLTSSRCVVDVTVVNVNDNPPVVNPSEYSRSLTESAPPGTLVVRVVATDADNSVQALNPLMYSLMTSSSRPGDAQSFIINDNGRIVTNRSLDFETLSRIVLTVNVSDGTYSSAATVTVTIRDFNDNSPQFYPPGVLRISPAEGTGERVVIGSVFANDTDASSNSLVAYRLLADNSTQDADKFFSVDAQSGNIVTRRRLEYHNDSYIFELLIVAEDFGFVRMSAGKQVIITIIDINDNSPVFEQDFYYFNLTEGASSQTMVGAVMATDADTGSGSQVVYRLVTSSSASLFAVDLQTGLITTNGSIDRELSMQYVLTIRAADLGNPPLSSTATVIIYIVDINDSPPYFDPDLSGNRYYIADKTPAGTSIVTSGALDVDIEQDLFYSLLVTPVVELAGGGGFLPGTGLNIFSIDNATGEIRTTQEATGEGISSVYNLTVAVHDGLYNVSQAIQIFIGLVNTAAPKFTSSSYYGVLEAGAEPGVLVSKVLAVDTDIGDFGQVTYSLVAADEYAKYFTLRVDGSLVLSQSLRPRTNAEAPQDSLRLTIQAQDGGGKTAESRITVHVYSGADVLELWMAGDAESVLAQSQAILEAYNEIVMLGTNQISHSQPMSVTQLPTDVIQHSTLKPQAGNGARKRRQLSTEENPINTNAATVTTSSVTASAVTTTSSQFTASGDDQSTENSSQPIPASSSSPADFTQSTVVLTDEMRVWTPIPVYTLVGVWYDNFTSGESTLTNTASFLSALALEANMNESFSQGVPRLGGIPEFVGWRRAPIPVVTMQPPSDTATEPDPELVQSDAFVNTPGGIATMTVVAVVLVVIILLLTKRLHDEYSHEKDTLLKREEITYDGWQHGMYGTDLGNDGQMLTFANEGAEEGGEYDDIEMQRMSNAWQQYYGDMYSDAATEETAVGESEMSDAFDSDDALLEEAEFHDPIYDNSHQQYFYGANFMQAQHSTIYADQAYLSGNSESDLEAVYDNIRHANQGPQVQDQSIYDNRQGVMALNMPSTLQEVMKTFFSGENYLVHGDAESEDEDEEQTDSATGAAAGGGAAGGAAADSDVQRALRVASQGDRAMADAESDDADRIALF